MPFLTMPFSHENQPDQKRIVTSLAARCHVPIDDVAALYEHERAELALDAHITKFLHIFATRNVLDILRERERESDLDKPTSVRPGVPVA